MSKVYDLWKVIKIPLAKSQRRQGKDQPQSEKGKQSSKETASPVCEYLARELEAADRQNDRLVLDLYRRAENEIRIVGEGK